MARTMVSASVDLGLSLGDAGAVLIAEGSLRLLPVVFVGANNEHE